MTLLGRCDERSYRCLQGQMRTQKADGQKERCVVTHSRLQECFDHGRCVAVLHLVVGHIAIIPCLRTRPVMWVFELPALRASVCNQALSQGVLLWSPDGYGRPLKTATSGVTLRPGYSQSPPLRSALDHESESWRLRYPALESKYFLRRTTIISSDSACRSLRSSRLA